MKTIGERIVFLRELHNMSQKELAQSIQITETSLSRYENNHHEPKSEIIIRMANIFQTSSDFLLGLSTDYEKSQKPGKIHSLTKAECQYLIAYRKLTPENKTCFEERIKNLLKNQPHTKLISKCR